MYSEDDHIWTRVEGQLRYVEAVQLFALAKATKPNTIILEIGAYRGKSTVTLALGAKAGNKNRVYSVDPHLPFEWRKDHWIPYGSEDQAVFYKNLTDVGVGDAVYTISLTSAQAAKAWDEKNIGLLWIDGNHAYEHVVQDLRVWLPFVVDGGTIAFHDFELRGVRRAIREARRRGDFIKKGHLRDPQKQKGLFWGVTSG